VSYKLIWGYHCSNDNSSLYQPRVIDVYVETEPKNPFGDVKSGYIKLDTLVTSG
jgi:hypothetical protein